MSNTFGARTVRLAVNIGDTLAESTEIPMNEFDGGSLMIDVGTLPTSVDWYVTDYGPTEKWYRLHTRDAATAPFQTTFASAAKGLGDGICLPLPEVTYMQRALKAVRSSGDTLSVVAVNKRLTPPELR